MDIFALMMTIAALAGWLHQRALRAREAARVRRPTLTRITDPKRQDGLVSAVWQLHSNGCRCQQARRLAGRRLAVDDTVPLRGIGLAQPCRCYYRPLRDERRQLRREAERRTTFRLDLLAQNRRMNGARRRNELVWQRSPDAA